MFYPMEEQASHVAKLMEENRRYLKENSRTKGRNSRVNNDSYNAYNNQVYSTATPDHDDTVMALQLQNSELNLCLEREKRRRKEAEARVERDEGYIRRLEDSVQTLRGTRVVMDQNTYKQVAEAYIAARRTPARRPHTHTGVTGSDLVCDNTHNPHNMGHHQRLSHPPLQQTFSCPSSPNSSLPMYPSLESQESQMYPGEISLGRSGSTKKDHRGHTSQDKGRGLRVGGNTHMNPWDYQELLQSLENIDGDSRGALS